MPGSRYEMGDENAGFAQKSCNINLQVCMDGVSNQHQWCEAGSQKSQSNLATRAPFSIFIYVYSTEHLTMQAAVVVIIVSQLDL